MSACLGPSGPAGTHGCNTGCPCRCGISIPVAAAPRHGHRFLDQAGLHMRLQTPAHHLTAGQVNDRCQAQPPSSVWMQVTSPRRNRLGSCGLKRRCAWSGATGRLRLLSVVTTYLRLILARIPRCRMSLRARSLPTRIPRAGNSLRIRDRPYSPLTSASMARMSAGRASSLRRRAGPPWPDSRRRSRLKKTADSDLRRLA